MNYSYAKKIALAIVLIVAIGLVIIAVDHFDVVTLMKRLHGG